MPILFLGTFKRGVTERGVFAFACQYIVSPRSRTGNRTVTQMRHPLLVEGRPNCARQSLASTLSAPRVAATSHCDPGRHANVITPRLLTPCLSVPNPPPLPKTQNYPPPKTRNSMDMGFFPAEERIFPGVHKIGAPISGPRVVRTNVLRIRGFFSSFSPTQEPPPSPFWAVNSDHGLSFGGEETRTMLSEFPFSLQIYSTLEFWRFTFSMV